MTDRAIRTPDQRLRVFVSSTLAELADERAAVAHAIERLRLTPVLFELGARPHPPRELYRAYLMQSDIFIGLYWQRYGWVGPGMEISGLEDEYRLSHSLPRLLYVKTPAAEREPGLTAMLDELRAEGSDSYRSFRTPRELGRLVRDDIAVLLSERFAASARPAGSPSTPPASKRADWRPARSLPVPTTTLIGREQEIEEVAQLLAKPEVRLVTLTGPGGIGKTRLAVAVGERLNERYPRGTVFVPLASITQPELVFPRVAATVGVTIEGARPPLDVLIELFAESPTLLVLDNLEQLIGVAPDLDELLARCPGLSILATSRTVLRLRAEHEISVTPLTVPELSLRAPSEQLADLPAVRLFVDRAQAVRHDFALTEQNAGAIAEICRRLDGLPLAIELAAARARLLEPAALLARLRGRFDALGSGPVDLPERQRTLRATVEWSVGLLDDAERQMLDTMSVFVDGWTLDAAVHVAELDEERALDLLDALAGHSLVTVEASAAEPRFRMFATIRQLAGERLAAGARANDVERRHAEFFGALVEHAGQPAERAVGQVAPAERQAEWAGQLRTEEGNLGVAIRWYFAHDIAPLPHILLVLCQNNWLFWQMRDRMHEGRAWIQELLLRADALEDRAHAEVLLIAAATAVEVGDDETVQAAVDALKQLERRVDDRYLESATQLAVSWTLPIADDFGNALAAASRALDGFREQDDPLMAWSALTVGLLEMTLGRDDDAHKHLTEANTLGGRFGNTWLELGACTQLGALAVRAGHLRAARTQLVDSLDAREETALSTQTVTFSLVAYARLELARRDARRAALALGAADGLRQRAGLRAWPSMRRGEAELVAGVEQAIEPAAYKEAFTAGSELNQLEAVAMVRGG